MKICTQWLGTTALVATLSAIAVPSTVFAQDQDEEAIEEVLVSGEPGQRQIAVSMLNKS